MLSLYVHIPFCVSKCSYCGFYSTLYGARAADAWLHALEREIALYADLLAERTAGTVYIGGGTPTVLSPEQLDRLLSMLHARVLIEPGAEVTIEANPGTLTTERMDVLRHAGVTRLSIGVQSFSDDILAALGRAHTAAEALQAVERARQSGFDAIGIDLIYGVPGQGREEWERTLRTALGLRPEHLSLYSLSADDGSRLKRQCDAGAVTLPDDDLTALQYFDACATLAQGGYRHYEISNFCRPGRECRHNLNYWARGEYLGLGPSAWSFIGERRWRNLADTAAYVERLASGRPVVEHVDSAGQEVALSETLMLRLRTAAGIDLSWFSSVFGAPAKRSLEERAAALHSSGLVGAEGGVLHLTERGMLLSNEAIGRLLP